MSQYTRYPVPFGPLPIFDTAANLPPFETDGYAAVTRDTNTIYIYDTDTVSWIPVATPGASIAITALTGDVTATGPGAVMATIPNSTITNAKMANMANNTVKGNKSGSPAAPSDLVLSDVSETGSAILTISNGTKAVVSASPLTLQVAKSSTSQDGYLSAVDWNTFNNKQAALTLPLTVVNGGTGLGTLTAGNVLLGAGTSSPTFVAPGTAGNVLSSNGSSWVSQAAPATGITTINSDATAGQTLVAVNTGTDFTISNPGGGVHNFNIPSSSAANRGLLTATDWSTFNNKQAAGNYITALTGDVTAAGPGSAASTLSISGVTAGTYGSAANVGAFTVDAKGRITAASNVGIVGPSFVFRPGGVATGNVYTSWSALYAALITLQGVRYIQIDDSLAACTIPAGTYDLSNVVLVGGGTGPILTCANGCVFSHMPDITNNLQLTTVSNSPVFTASGGGLLFSFISSLAVITVGGSAPFFHITTGQLYAFLMLDSATVSNGTHEVFTVDAGGALIIYLSVGTNVDNDTLGGGGDITGLVEVGSAFISPTQAGLSGTLSTGLNDLALFHFFNNSATSIAAGNVQDAITEIDTQTTHYELVTMVAAGSHTLADHNGSLKLTAAGTIASYTVSLPTNPDDGKLVFISTSQIVTAFTLAGNGHTIVGSPPAALALGQALRYQFIGGVDNRWWPV